MARYSLFVLKILLNTNQPANLLISSPGLSLVKGYKMVVANVKVKCIHLKRSGMARVLKGFYSFTCTPTRSSAIGMSHTCLCLPSRS